jgi:RNA-directed DNA polymerase
MSLQSRIASELLLSPQFVSLITRSASKRYKQYTIAKKSGGLRTIFHPSRELKALQRWLLGNVIQHWPVHSAAFAYRAHRGIKDNASVHKDNAYLLKLDFDTFFPSIRSDDLQLYLESGPSEALQWNDQDRKTFLSLVCRNGQLTIGAPTSPALSNAVCFVLDSRLAAWSSEHGITYTRYADDITLSCNRPGVLKDAPQFVESTLRNLAIPSGLRLNQKKTRNLSRRHRRMVTGIILTSTGEVSLGRGLKRKLRSLIYRHEMLSIPERSSLAGFLSYAVSIEPDLLNRLVLKFGPEIIDRVKLSPRASES